VTSTDYAGIIKNTIQLRSLFSLGRCWTKDHFWCCRRIQARISRRSAGTVCQCVSLHTVNRRDAPTSCWLKTEDYCFDAWLQFWRRWSAGVEGSGSRNERGAGRFL